MNKSSLSAPVKDALGLLLDDHRKAQKLFKDFEKAKEAGDKESIAREVCADLKLHTRIEEELFYPALRKLDEKTFGKMLDEAEVEHASAKDLISQIEGSGLNEALFEARVTVLREYVSHHIEEEESEMFPAILDKDLDLRELGKRMMSMKQEAMQGGKAA